jgi:hypothetical protein
MNKGYVIVNFFFFNSGINQVIVSENDFSSDEIRNNIVGGSFLEQSYRVVKTYFNILFRISSEEKSFSETIT